MFKKKSISLGDPAAKYLEQFGIAATSQPIRGSDWNNACSDPFGYYLSRRLSLRPALQVSKALSAGSWGHTAAEHHGLPPVKRQELFKALLKKNLTEMRDVGRALNIHADKIADSVIREERMALSGTAWWNIIADMPIGEMRGTISNMFDGTGNLHIIAQEPVIRIKGSHFDVESDIVIQPDAIAVNRNNKTVWLIDWKSSAWPTVERLSICPLEFPTQLYSHVFNHCMLNEKNKIAFLDKPEYADYTFGGMLHVAYIKPTIEFGTKDRPYRIVSEGKRTGIYGFLDVDALSRTIQIKSLLKGVWSTDTTKYTSELDAIEALHILTGKKPTKEYEEEPVYELYLNRCEEWYAATGEYTHLQDERANNPPVNSSNVPFAILQTPEALIDFQNRLSIIDNYAMQPPHPELFPKHGNPTGYQTKPSYHAYFPFYTTPLDKWPDIIQQKRLIQDPRNKPTGAA